METCIDPKIIEILKQLDDTKDSVIIAGRGAVDSNREAHVTIKQLREEKDKLTRENQSLRDDKKRDDKVVWASTWSMITSWILVAVFYVYTVLGGL